MMFTPAWGTRHAGWPVPWQDEVQGACAQGARAVGIRTSRRPRYHHAHPVQRVLPQTMGGIQAGNHSWPTSPHPKLLDAELAHLARQDAARGIRLETAETCWLPDARSTEHSRAGRPGLGGGEANLGSTDTRHGHVRGRGAWTVGSRRCRIFLDPRGAPAASRGASATTAVAVLGGPGGARLCHRRLGLHQLLPGPDFKHPQLEGTE